MAINKDYNYIPLQRAKYASELPLDFMHKSLGELQQRSDRNFAALEQAPQMLSVPVHEADYQRRAELEAGIRNKIAAISKGNNGDFSGASKDVYGLQAEVKRLLGPSGDIGAMAQNYAMNQEYKKGILADKLLSTEEKQQAIAESNRLFSQAGGTGMVDPLTGARNSFNGLSITGFDMTKALKDFTKIDPILVEKMGVRKEGNYFIDTKTGMKVNDPERISSILQAGLMANTDFNEWLQGRQRIGLGVPQDKINMAIQAEANARSFYEKTIDEKRTWDKMLDYNLERDKFNYKKSRDAQQDAADKQAAMGYQIVGLDATPYKPLTLDALNKISTGAAPLGAVPSQFGGSGFQDKSQTYTMSNMPLDFNHPNVKNNKALQESMDFVASQFAQNQPNNNYERFGSYGLFNKVQAPKKIDYNNLSQEGKNKFIASQGEAFKKAALDHYNQGQNMLHSNSIGMFNITSTEHSENIGSQLARYASTLEVYDPNKNVYNDGTHSKGTLSAAAAEMGIKDLTYSTKGKLQEGQGRLLVLGKNSDDGTFRVQLVGPKESKVFKLPDPSRGQNDLYRDQVARPYSQAAGAVFDPHLRDKKGPNAQFTYPKGKHILYDANGNHLGGVDVRESAGGITMLKVEDANIFSQGIHKINGLTFNTDSFKVTGSNRIEGVATNASGQKVPIMINSRTLDAEPIFANDSVFSQNMKNKEQRQNTPDANEYDQ